MLIKMLVAGTLRAPINSDFRCCCSLFCSFAFFGTVSLETNIKLVNPDYI